jgi:hypothetical protein
MRFVPSTKPEPFTFRQMEFRTEITGFNREQLRPAFLSWGFDTWDTVGEHCPRSEDASHYRAISQTILQLLRTGEWLCSPLRMKEEES